MSHNINAGKCLEYAVPAAEPMFHEMSQQLMLLLGLVGAEVAPVVGEINVGDDLSIVGQVDRFGGQSADYFIGP